MPHTVNACFPSSVNKRKEYGYSPGDVKKFVQNTSVLYGEDKVIKYRELRDRYPQIIEKAGLKYGPAELLMRTRKKMGL